MHQALLVLVLLVLLVQLVLMEHSSENIALFVVLWHLLPFEGDAAPLFFVPPFFL